MSGRHSGIRAIDKTTLYPNRMTIREGRVRFNVAGSDKAIAQRALADHIKKRVPSEIARELGEALGVRAKKNPEQIRVL